MVLEKEPRSPCVPKRVRLRMASQDESHRGQISTPGWVTQEDNRITSLSSLSDHSGRETAFTR